MNWLKSKLTNSNFDFVGKRKTAAIVSMLMVIASWTLFVFPGPNWGIDFTGGTEVHLRFDDEVSINDMRASLVELGLPSDAVQEVDSDSGAEFKIRIQDPEFGSAEIKAEVTDALNAGMPEGWLKEMAFSSEVGARFAVTYSGDRTPPDTVKAVLADIQGIKVEEGREDNEVIIKLPGLSAQIQKQVASAMGDRVFEVLAVDAVGPKVGNELRRQGFTSIAATLGLVLLYVAFRFDIGFAPGAILALIHDVSVTVGVFILTGREFNLPIIGALLTIVGYSLNDTIVIYDRIRENRTRYRRKDLEGLINVSINETLARTVATSFTTFLAISAFLFMGGSIISDFAFAMLCGIIFGTYSTMFVASPMIIVMETVTPWLSGLIAVPMPDEEEGDDIPEAFQSESEKRRRERARLEREAADNVGGA